MYWVPAHRLGCYEAPHTRFSPSQRFTGHDVTLSGTFPLGSGVLSYFPFLLQVQNGLTTTRSWLVSAALLLELGKAPTSNKHHRTGTSNSGWSIVFSLLDRFLKHWRYCIHKYWHIFFYRNCSFILYIFLIIHSTLFAKFLILDLFFYMAKRKVLNLGTFCSFIFSFLILESKPLIITINMSDRKDLFYRSEN